MVLLDRRFPDLFAAEKIELDQDEMMRSLGLLEFRSPLAPPVGDFRVWDGVEKFLIDKGQQYGISYSETANSSRDALPESVDFQVQGRG